MPQTRCSCCINEPRSNQIHCPECKGSTWICAPNNCKHYNAEGEAMTGGWICYECGDSGPGIPPTWTWDAENKEAIPPTKGNGE